VAAILFTAACGSGEYGEYIGSRDFASPAQIGFVWDVAGTNFQTSSLTDTNPHAHVGRVARQATVFTADGQIHRVNGFANAILSEHEDGGIDLKLADGRVFVNIAGVIANPPETVITQAYYDALYYLQAGNRVMIIVLDGWGWHMQRYHAEHQPFLSAQQMRMAHTVFPPFTPVAMASIFTGQTPDMHGVHDRATRTMAAPDIFTAAYELGFSSTRVQGGVNIVQTSVLSALIPNLGHVFDTDRGVFEAAISRIDDTDLMFIHFNAVDDTSHTYGPYSPQTGEAMAFVDQLVRDLVAAWDGVTIILADHGQHYLGQQGRLGDHLWVSHEDIFVPYVVIGGR